MAADRKHSERIESLHDYGIDEETRSIYFYDDVHDDSAAALIKNLNVLCTDNDKPVNIYMQTLGGCGFSGITLHDYIRSLRNNHVTIIVMGYCMSAGPIILQAADTRVCMPNSSIMIHEGSLFVNDTLSNSTEWARVAPQLVSPLLPASAVGCRRGLAGRAWFGTVAGVRPCRRGSR